MKNYVIVSIQDVVAGSYGAPQVFPNLNAARRWFGQVNEGNPFAADTRLWVIGEYDVDSGAIVSCEKSFLMDYTLSAAGEVLENA